MLSKRTAIYVTFILLLTQTPPMHGVTIFGYDFDIATRIVALYSKAPTLSNAYARMYNYIWISYAIDNFSQIWDTEAGYNTIKTILEHDPNAAQAFVQPAIDNFPLMCNNWNGWDILQEIIEHYPNAAQAFTKPAADNFPLMCDNGYGCYILQEIMKHYPASAQTFDQLVTYDNIFNINSHLLIELVKRSPDSQSPSNIIQSIKPTFIQFITQSFYPFTDLVEHKTQTNQHLMVHLFDKFEHLSSEGYVNYQDNDELQKMTKLVINLEHKEQQKGRYTFVHAHQWAYHFYQELYTDLWGIINERPSNYRFTRFKYPIKPSTESFFAYIQKEQEVRTKIMTDAVDQYYTRAGYQDRLLFMNYALFANYRGSNTGYYIKQNKSENSITINCNQFLSELHLNELLTQEELEYVRKQFSELQAEHATLSNYGGGLLLSFTPELMAQCVYPCDGGGPKRTVEIEGIGETSDPHIILDTLRTAPEKIVDSDNIEFVCILSHDSSLIPNNGLDVYEFNAADQDKLAAWRAKKDKLMVWIKECVDKRRQILTAQAAAKHMRARL